MDDSQEAKPKSAAFVSRALNGDIQAQFEMALALEEEKQLDTAAGWYSKAATQGHAQAALHAGLLCLKGDKTVQQGAVYWMQRAASSGNSEAEFQLALIYERGIGVRMDPDESLRWLRQAAVHGNKRAVEKLEKLSGFLDQLIPDPPRRKAQ
jgi:uncharacterized protein